ncbi:MAG: hypothetical protein IT307_08410 [Chloroflexi bacterium]|nr:hypothetical protein [Chloroflexota bacterium]
MNLGDRFRTGLEARAIALVFGLSAALVAGPTADAAGSRVMLAGSFVRDASGMRGELVQVAVPWSGVTDRADIMACVTGPFLARDNVVQIQRDWGMVKLRLSGGDEGAWQVLEGTGACAGLRGGGDYRLTTTPMLRLDGELDRAAAEPEPQAPS